MATPFIQAQPQPKYFSSSGPAESSLPENFYEDILSQLSPEQMQSLLEMVQSEASQPGLEGIAGLAETQGQSVGPYKGYVGSSPFSHLARGLAMKGVLDQGKKRKSGVEALLAALRGRGQPRGLELPEPDFENPVLGG